MEKPNPDNYNSTGFYLDDLEKYNHMKEKSKEEMISGKRVNMKEFDRVPDYLADMVTVKDCSILMEEYATLFKDTASKGAVWVKASERLPENINGKDSKGNPILLKTCWYDDDNNKLIKRTMTINQLKDSMKFDYRHIYWLDESESNFVWDYSDIAIKFANWFYLERGIEFENENEAFSEFFEEVYNKTKR